MDYIDDGWRTVQLFVGEEGISEVEVDSTKPNTIRCNCKKFLKSKKCLHISHVREAMLDNNGHYTVHIPQEIEDDEAIEAMADKKLFRAFVLKYGKIEVL